MQLGVRIATAAGSHRTGVLTMTAVPVPPPAARLVGFRIRPDAALPAPFDRGSTLVEFERVEAVLQGFVVSVRGSAVFLISPPGWRRNLAAALRNPDGKRKIFGPIPISSVTLIWEAADPSAVDKLQRYDSEPLAAPRPAGKELPQIDPKELGDP